jgi:hypothetical protein
MPQVQATPAHRNAPILAAEAQFSERAADLVSLVMRRAHGGDPVCLRLCLERALPAGRLPPADLDLGPVHDVEGVKRAFAAIGALVGENRINIRQASRLLDALGAPVRARPAVAQVRKFAEIEADLAKTLASLGLDDFLTVAPRAPGGILENQIVADADSEIKRPPTPDPRAIADE